MTEKSIKTIDDLGRDVYLNYETARQLSEESFVTESKTVADQLQRDVSTPIYVSFVHHFFQLPVGGTLWSLPHPPPYFNEQKKRLFTHQLAPKFGPTEYLERQMERIEDKVEELKSNTPSPNGRILSWEHDPALSQTRHEGEVLIDLLESITLLNNDIEDVNAERIRFSKG